MTASDPRIDTLLTVRDWLRYAVSRFTAAGLIYGHGTTTALDEAAFLILETLRLPIDDLAPWLDARLLASERQSLAAIIEQRVSTRKPASYLTRSAYIQGHRFYVDERVIVPRSFIGELLLGDGLDLAIADQDNMNAILDLCTGGGSLAILAALSFPDAHITAVDISADALEVARRNVSDYGLQDRITLIQSDLFAGLGDTRFDLILSNPPYVTEAAVMAFPPEYGAEPRLAHAGGADGMDLVRRILAGGGRHLEPDGALIVEVGQGRAALEASHPKLPFLWLDTEDSIAEVFALDAEHLTPVKTAPKPPSRRKSGH
ncbi:MAG: 50S ribosomal protein L3 N(5)-glutamine methyltransferase [Hyphomicrobiaceae bacterium]